MIQNQILPQIAEIAWIIKLLSAFPASWSFDEKDSAYLLLLDFNKGAANNELESGLLSKVSVS